MDASQSKKELKEYKAQFIKGGITPTEFERCLGKKVEKLSSNLPGEVKVLIVNAKTKVKQNVCIRENEKNPLTLDQRYKKLTLDQRYKKSLAYYDQEGILPHGQHPMVMVNQTRGQQGVRRQDKVWQRQYHKQQHTFFTLPFIRDKLWYEFPQIKLKEDQKGFLFHICERQLSSIEFCRVIDHITADLVEELSTLSQGNHDNNYTAQWQKRLVPVSQSCKKIVTLRLMVDFCNDNDLMTEKGYEVWRDHLMVMMSFAAMLVVAEAFIDGLDKNSGPNPAPNANGGVNIKAYAVCSFSDTISTCIIIVLLLFSISVSEFQCFLV